MSLQSADPEHCPLPSGRGQSPPSTPNAEIIKKPPVLNQLTAERRPARAMRLTVTGVGRSNFKIGPSINQRTSGATPGQFCNLKARPQFDEVAEAIRFPPQNDSMAANCGDRGTPTTCLRAPSREAGGRVEAPATNSVLRDLDLRSESPPYPRPHGSGLTWVSGMIHRRDDEFPGSPTRRLRCHNFWAARFAVT